LQYNPVQAHPLVQLTVAVEFEGVEDWYDTRQAEANKHEGPIDAPLRCAEVFKPRYDQATESKESNLSKSTCLSRRES
jgi:hypothetical protein